MNSIYKYIKLIMLSKKEINKMIVNESIKKENRNKNKIWSEGFMFDISKMPTNTKSLFNEFLNEYKYLTDKHQLEKKLDLWGSYDKDEDWIYNWIEKRDKLQDNIVIIFIEGEELNKLKSNRENKWFCQRLNIELKNFNEK